MADNTPRFVAAVHQHLHPDHWRRRLFGPIDQAAQPSDTEWENDEDTDPEYDGAPEDGPHIARREIARLRYPDGRSLVFSVTECNGGICGFSAYYLAVNGGTIETYLVYDPAELEACLPLIESLEQRTDQGEVVGIGSVAWMQAVRKYGLESCMVARIRSTHGPGAIASLATEQASITGIRSA